MAAAGIFLPPFEELSDPALVAELAVAAEDAGWDGFFVWDHLQYRDPVEAVADPWITLAAVASRTSRIRIGALVTPLARRRPQVVARQVTTLDHLSGGRMVLGAALGRDQSGRELSAFGEELDDRTRAAMLDESLEVIAALWSGERVDHDGRHHQARDVRFSPRPLQRPRVPVWIGGRWPNVPPIRRAIRWDGYFPVDVADADTFAACVARVRELRGSLDGFDVIAETAPDADPTPWMDAGASWVLASFGIDKTSPKLVREVVAAGPRAR